MIDETFVEKIAELAVQASDVQQFEIDGLQFTDRALVPLNKPQPKTLGVTTLTGLVDYLRANPDGHAAGDLLVHVIGPTQVEIKGTLQRPEMTRPTLLVASPLLPEFKFASYYDQESFIIALQSRFQRTETRDGILKLVSTITEENVRTSADDGVSQQVTARAGIVTVATVTVPNPVELAPYRTFIEVPQPSSPFVLRLKDGPTAAIFEADGGAWRNTAMASIEQYLRSALAVDDFTAGIPILA
jgi:hypothetical protein